MSKEFDHGGPAKIREQLDCFRTTINNGDCDYKDILIIGGETEKALRTCLDALEKYGSENNWVKSTGWDPNFGWEWRPNDLPVDEPGLEAQQAITKVAKILGMKHD